MVSRSSMCCRGRPVAKSVRNAETFGCRRVETLPAPPPSTPIVELDAASPSYAYTARLIIDNCPLPLNTQPTTHTSERTTHIAPRPSHIAHYVSHTHRRLAPILCPYDKPLSRCVAHDCCSAAEETSLRRYATTRRWTPTTPLT